jgi:hypothetical protein
MDSDFERIGDKVISVRKINKFIEDILSLRRQGYSQQEVANLLDTDRSFISRLEKIGEIRKGGDIAVIGFPVQNKDELYRVLRDAGVDYILLMTEKERNDFVKGRTGADFFNDIMSITTKIREYHNTIVIGSDYRSRMANALLDGRVYTINIGKSPIKEDVYVNPERVLEIVDSIKY